MVLISFPYCLLLSAILHLAWKDARKIILCKNIICVLGNTHGIVPLPAIEIVFRLMRKQTVQVQSQGVLIVLQDPVMSEGAGVGSSSCGHQDCIPSMLDGSMNLWQAETSLYS